MGKVRHELCLFAEDHTPCPEGYIQWHAWAAEMSKTHRQEKCGECGRYAVWVPKADTLAADWAGDWQHDTPSNRPPMPKFSTPSPKSIEDR